MHRPDPGRRGERPVRDRSSRGSTREEIGGEEHRARHNPRETSGALPDPRQTERRKRSHHNQERQAQAPLQFGHMRDVRRVKPPRRQRTGPCRESVVSIGFDATAQALELNDIEGGITRRPLVPSASLEQQEPAARLGIHILAAGFGPHRCKLLSEMIAHEHTEETAPIGVDIVRIGHPTPVVETMEHARRNGRKQ